MKWLYYVQQRFSITSTECTAILCIVGLFFVGQITELVRSAGSPFDESYYAEIDEQFRRGVERLRGEDPEAVPPRSETADIGDSTYASGALTEARANPSDTTRRRSQNEAPLGRMNLNTATAAQLQRLPGIGPALAGRIIEYREEHGPFSSVSEVTKVRGIGPRTLENIESFLFVGEEE